MQVTGARHPEQEAHDDDSPAPVSEPDPSALTCPGDKGSPCAACQRKTQEYGSGGSPLSLLVDRVWCDAG
jgi:hypothetical protein